MLNESQTTNQSGRYQTPSRASLILQHQKLVHYVVARFQGKGENVEDLVQVGTIGLINALDRYDPSKNIKFSTYAMPTIIGEIKRHFRDKTWHIKVPRGLQELSLNAARAQQELTSHFGHPPTLREIAERLSVSEDDAQEALKISHLTSTLSLDARLEAADGTVALLDMMGQTDPALNDIDAHADLRRVLNMLEGREKQVIHLRFFEELSQAKTACHMNISQMRVSRLQQRALQRLASALSDHSAPTSRRTRRAPGAYTLVP